MREIKFRAWDKVYKRMIYVFNPISHGEIDVFNFNFLKNYDGDYEVMQFTGLLDRNGKEIWEGDIVKFNAVIQQSIGEVYWRNGFYMKNWEHLELDCETFKNAKMWEVIGNIYENPELLGEKP